MSMVLSDFVASFLIENGVEHVFGYQGSAIAKIIDSTVKTGRIQYIQNYHEQASALAADGYARASGKVGVAFATSGPGATNLVTGIANAQLDSIPVLFITGQDYTHRIYQSKGRLNGFQDLDIVGVVKPITKYAVTVMDPSRIRYELEKAFYLAHSGRPGATLIDIPIDLQFKTIIPDELEGYTPPSQPQHCAAKDVGAVLSLLATARRPLILAGGGVRTAKAETALQRFVAASGLPVVTTLNGSDAVEGALGFAGLYGNPEANLAVQNADLLLVLGARLGQHHVGKVIEKYTRAKIIHVDIDAEELGRVIAPDVAVCTDVKSFLDALCAVTTSHHFQNLSAWREILRRWQQDFSRNVQLTQDGLDPVRVLRTLTEAAADDAIIAGDVGQSQMWLAQAFKVRDRQRLLNSSGLGAMGYALPAAIGARIACASAQVIAITGDGGLQMNLQELTLIGHKKLDIKCVVVNNNALGMIREVQTLFYDRKHYGADEEYFTCPDIGLLAKAFGCDHVRIDDESQMEVLLAAVKTPGPSLIEICIGMDTPLLNHHGATSVYEANRIDDEDAAS